MRKEVNVDKVKIILDDDSGSAERPVNVAIQGYLKMDFDATPEQLITLGRMFIAFARLVQ